MKICSINSQGFSALKQAAIFDSARAHDFVFIQEALVSEAAHIARLSAEWSGPSFWSPALGHWVSVAVLVSPAFPGKIDVWRRDSEGRVISLLVSCGRNKINFINIYAPTNLSDHKTFFENLHDYFISADTIILGGDFNCYEYVLDKCGGNSSPAKYLSNFRCSFNLVDIFRKLHPHSRDVSCLIPIARSVLALINFCVSYSC